MVKYFLYKDSELELIIKTNTEYASMFTAGRIVLIIKKPLNYNTTADQIGFFYKGYLMSITEKHLNTLRLLYE